MKLVAEIKNKDMIQKVFETINGDAVRKTSIVMQNIANKIYNQLKTVSGISPVGVGKTKGNFKKNWNYDESKTGPNVAFQANIKNMVIYAAPLEEGSDPGQSPWPNPGSRTVSYEGKIFSSQAPGGVTKKVLDDINFSELDKIKL
jgi:hypothetical protein